MQDQLVCDDCGSLNPRHATVCSLCGASLEEEHERAKLGDPRIIAACASILTVAWAGIAWFLLGMAYYAGGPESLTYDIDQAAVMIAVVIGLGVFVLALWGAAWKAWRAAV